MARAETPDHEVIIIGSGPAGYTAAIYTARAGLEPVVMTGSTIGGELTNTTEVENFPGFPDGILGPELMEKFRAQAERFGTQIVPEIVTDMNLNSPVKTVTTEAGDTYSSRALILAMGSQYRKLGLPAEERLSGRGISWCATCDGFFFRDHDIAVVGGGDSAIEEALFLTKFARSVTIIHRRDQLRASKILQDRAFAHEKISFLWNTEVQDIFGEKSLEGIKLHNAATGASTDLAVTGLFVAIGADPRTELVRETVTLTADGTICTRPGSSATSIDGVFAVGDVADARYRQAITAAASGCMAAMEVGDFLAIADHEIPLLSKGLS